MIEPALGKRDQRSGERPTARDQDQTLDALVARQRLEGRRHRDRLAARGESALGEIEAHDLVHALNADINRVAIHGERLAVVPAALRERNAAGAEHWRRFDIGETGRTVVAIDDAAAEPASLVAERKEACAVRADAQCGEPAELLERRRER